MAAVWSLFSGISPPVTQANLPSASDDVVRLSPGKLQAAGLHSSPVELREFRPTRSVPGKIVHNQALRLELTSPSDAVVRQILVSPGQQVHAGDRLVVLTSSDIGLARDEVRGRAADMKLAQRESDWAEQIATNLAELLEFLETKPEPKQVEEQFQDKVLGEHRGKVLNSYTGFVLADRLLAAADPNVLSMKVLQERRASRETTLATYESTREQAEFESIQERDRRLAAVEHAARLLAVSQQKLGALLGPYADKSIDEESSAISDLVLRAPFDGVLEERFVVAAERLKAGQRMFALADTATVWVSAQIYERDWAEVEVLPDQEVLVRAKALGGKPLVAKVRYVAGSVSLETRAVPLVAELDNAERRLKPGMFVWVEIPLGEPRRNPAVPSAALLRHEDEAFVFIAAGEDAFRKRPVEVGLETPDWIEIMSGLKEGESVIDRGAFFLKSEMLLEGMVNE